jgi:SNF2 family DNA or RNA helicase
MRQKSELRPYQQRIASALYESDEKIAVARPGGGKTIAGLTAIQELIRDKHTRHALVIAPKRVARMVWPDEIKLWAHTKDLRYQVLTGSPQMRSIGLAEAHAGLFDITIIGIDLVEWLADQLAKLPEDSPLFDLLVIDEISKLRNPSGVRARRLLRHAKRWKMVWGLTGTLRPSGAENLFMPATVVTRAKLWGKSFYRWRRERFYPLDYQGYTWAPLPGAEEIINKEIAPLCVTLRDDELPQLPELSIIFDRIELPPAARKHYEDMHEELVLIEDGAAVIAKTAAVATGKLAQIANGFVYDNGVTIRLHGEKEQWAEEIIDDADAPVLFIYEYREDLEMLRGLLGEDLPYLGAGVTNKTSDQNITRWNKGELPFMALHPASGGHGLNLQHGGSDMAWICPTWSPEMWEQTIARLHRSGQTAPVIVRVCVADDTVDQMKLDRVHAKMTAQEAFEAYLRRHQELVA